MSVYDPDEYAGEQTLALLRLNARFAAARAEAFSALGATWLPLLGSFFRLRAAQYRGDATRFDARADRLERRLTHEAGDGDQFLPTRQLSAEEVRRLWPPDPPGDGA